MKDEEMLAASMEMNQYNTDDNMQLEVGVHYQGSFWIDRRGMIRVRPYKTGSKPSALTKVADGNYYTLYKSKNLYRIVFSFAKNGKETLRKQYQEAVLECYSDLSQIDEL
jgi:hypothetical protein